MMRQATPQIRSLHRSLALLHALILDGGRRSAQDIGFAIGYPRATTHRMVQTLRESGHIQAVGRGYYIAGPAMQALAPALDRQRIVAGLARPLLRDLSTQMDRITHLGILENDMVTYLIKEGQGSDQLFTREEMQLEAYCSGIGKVLLAHLPPVELARYLEAGPFVALTSQTIVAPAQIMQRIQQVKSAGYAVDDREIAPDLRCIAVPIFAPGAEVRFAISASRIDGAGQPLADVKAITQLQTVALQIGRLVETVFTV